MLGTVLLLGLAGTERWPGLHISRSPSLPSPPPPPRMPSGVFSTGHRCGNSHSPVAMFVDDIAGCQALVMGQKHDAKGTMLYFAWSSFTLYCYGCAEAEVQAGSLVVDRYYDVYEVYSIPFYDPVAAFASRPPCWDTPGWHSGNYETCQVFAERHWCIDGTMEWLEMYGGQAFRFPEQNCCVCGGGSTIAPAPSPPPSDHPLPCVDLLLRASVQAQASTLVVPGSFEPGTVVRRWTDPASKSCDDYAIRAWCSASAVLSERMAGVHNNNPEDACCVCGGGVHKEQSPPPPFPPPSPPPPHSPPPPPSPPPRPPSPSPPYYSSPPPPRRPLRSPSPSPPVWDPKLPPPLSPPPPMAWLTRVGKGGPHQSGPAWPSTKTTPPSRTLPQYSPPSPAPSVAIPPPDQGWLLAREAELAELQDEEPRQPATILVAGAGASLCALIVAAAVLVYRRRAPRRGADSAAGLL